MLVCHTRQVAAEVLEEAANGEVVTPASAFRRTPRSPRSSAQRGVRPGGGLTPLLTPRLRTKGGSHKDKRAKKKAGQHAPSDENQDPQQVHKCNGGLELNEPCGFDETYIYDLGKIQELKLLPVSEDSQHGMKAIEVKFAACIRLNTVGANRCRTIPAQKTFHWGALVKWRERSGAGISQ